MIIKSIEKTCKKHVDTYKNIVALLFAECTIFVTPMNKNIRVLLIEDDEDDVETFQHALNSYKVTHELHVIGNGGTAAKFFGECVVAPDVIVLDINLPQVTGTELIKMIRRSPLLEATPVIMYSTANDRATIDHSLKLGANRFVVKPNNFKDIHAVVNVIIELTGYYRKTGN